MIPYLRRALRQVTLDYHGFGRFLSTHLGVEDTAPRYRQPMEIHIQRIMS